MRFGTAYQDVRSDKTDTNWLLLDYEVITPHTSSVDVHS
jgi:hypothetical protein